MRRLGHKPGIAYCLYSAEILHGRNAVALLYVSERRPRSHSFLAREPDSIVSLATPIALSFKDESRDYPDRWRLGSVRPALEQAREEEEHDGDHDEAQSGINDGGPSYNRISLDRYF